MIAFDFSSYLQFVLCTFMPFCSKDLSILKGVPVNKLCILEKLKKRGIILVQ